MRPAPQLNSKKHRPRRSLPNTRPRSRMPMRIKRRTTMVRGDAEATMRAANVLLDVSEENGLRITRAVARMCLSWAQARLGGADELARFRGSRRDDHQSTAVGSSAPLFHGRLAELEAEQMSADEALTSIDRAIELARKGDIRYIDALLHRIRGDILLRRDPDERRPGRRSLPHRHRRRARAGRAQLRPAGGAEAGETLPIHRPPRRSPRHPRARARRLLADAGDGGNRRGRRRCSPRSPRPTK